MQVEQDLSVVRDVRCHAQDDSNFLQLNSCTRNCVRAALCATLLTLRSKIQNTDWNFLTNQNLSTTIVERHDTRLSLKIRKADFLESVEEARELEFSKCCREDELERRVYDACVRV